MTPPASTATMPAYMKNLHDARLIVWVKENLRRAREEPAAGERETMFAAGIHFGARESQVSKWENPDKGGPGPKALARVVTYIERRLKVKAPR